MKSVIASSILAVFAPLASVAGEIGVSNNYSNSFREGTGSSVINFVSNSQVTEQSTFGAFKVEGSSFTTEETGALVPSNNGNGNGNGNAFGDSQAPSSDGLSFQSGSFAASWGAGTRNATSATSAQGVTTESYSFGDTSFNHSLSVFSR